MKKCWQGGIIQMKGNIFATILHGYMNCQAHWHLHFSPAGKYNRPKLPNYSTTKMLLFKKIIPVVCGIRNNH